MDKLARQNQEKFEKAKAAEEQKKKATELQDSASIATNLRLMKVPLEGGRLKRFTEMQ